MKKAFEILVDLASILAAFILFGLLMVFAGAVWAREKITGEPV